MKIFKFNSKDELIKTQKQYGEIKYGECVSLQKELTKLRGEHLKLLKKYNKRSNEYLKFLEEYKRLITGIGLQKRSELCKN